MVNAHFFSLEIRAFPVYVFFKFNVYYTIYYKQTNHDTQECFHPNNHMSRFYIYFYYHVFNLSSQVSCNKMHQSTEITMYSSNQIAPCSFHTSIKYRH